LYSTFTAFLGFEVNEGEYKVMGMAPYGEPRYLEKLNKVAQLFDDGSLRLEPSYFSYQYSSQRSFSRRFVDLFGTPRDPKLEFVTGRADTGQGPEELMQQLIGGPIERPNRLDRRREPRDLVRAERHCCASVSSTRIESSTASSVPRLVAVTRILTGM